jgi:two-component system chemotaxis sensor kinase CheA
MPSFEQLREQIDSLATEAMIGSTKSTESLLASLSGLAQQAEILGLTGASTTVSKLSGKESLLAGISQLQKVIEDAPAEAVPGPPAPAVNALAADPELLNDFLVESRDHLTSVEGQLLIIEREPTAKDAVHSVFRGFHTIKGLAGFLELDAIRGVAHEVETLLDLARNGTLTLAPSVIDLILESADYLKTELNRVEEQMNGAPAAAPGDSAPLLARIQAHMRGEVAVVEAPKDAPKAAPPAPAPVETPKLAVVPSPASVPLRVAPPAKPASDDNVQKAAATSESRVVKVDIEKLDFLVDMVGELVIAQSMVTHDRSLEIMANPKLQRNLSQLTRITGEVQKTAMAMRMVPIGQLFKRSVRLVRDLARKSGKEAELHLSGEETEVDRNIVEELADPLMHMIRNAADHGIEMPEDRVKAGKPRTARIHLKASHQAGYVMIEIGDDGRGLDREKILKKARERGLVQDGSELADKEVFNLIFEPGFSTAEKVTDISGRGVGMDVVRKQIQRMRGRVDIESQLGHGTTFFLKLPLTLAIIDGLVVGVGGERYVVPIYAVREMFRPAPDSIFTAEGRNEMVLVRGGLLPVLRLYQRFGVTPKSGNIVEGLLVVVESESRRFCFTVDEVIDTQEVVIKSLGETFRHVAGIAGGTILGDGRVGLILDVEGLSKDANA